MPPKTEGKRLTLDGFHELMLKDPWYTHQYILYIRVIDGHLCYTRGEGYRRTIDDFLKEIVKKGIDLVDPQDRQIAEAAALYRANLSGEKTQHSHAYQFHLNILKLRFYGARLPKEAENFGKIWSAIQQSKSEAYKVCAEALAFQHGWNRTINFYAALDRYQEAQKLANGAEKIPVFKLIIDAYETKQYDDVIKSTLGAEPADVIMAFLWHHVHVILRLNLIMVVMKGFNGFQSCFLPKA